MAVTVFGIRHHGPGSARSLETALAELDPDLVLVEGPPDADDAIALASSGEMRPPVAILVYVPDSPRRSVFYPFASFSPEWRAIRFATARGIPVRFMDLPQAHRLAGEDGGEGEAEPDATDPLALLAMAAGFPDGEKWWGAMVEERRDGTGIFEAVLDAMRTLREELAKDGPGGADPDPREARREAYMRRVIRKAAREGFDRIAVVCGAWHAPALADRHPVKPDDEILRRLPRVKVAATWVPWTHGRLARASGYGAGVESPGWYDHLFRTGAGVAVRWLTKAARLLRENGLDVSSAHVIESVRLAEALAALRDRPAPGLSELTESIRTVMLFGDELPLALVEGGLVVGERMGAIPRETPQVPLRRDLEKTQRRLRLKPGADERRLVLDLRKESGLGRSVLLRRLRILGVPWGEPADGVRSRGTFKEAWDLRWQAEFEVRIIEASRYGPTVADAAASRAAEVAGATDRVQEVAAMLEEVLPADLPAAVRALVDRLRDLAAMSGDLTQLMRALPPLARILRYGDVRGTEAPQVEEIVAGIVERVAVGLPLVCSGLDEEAAAGVLALVDGVHEAVNLLERDEWREDWLDALEGAAEADAIPGLIRGRATRHLRDAGRIDAGAAARRLSFALSPAEEPPVAAAWLEGFLGASGEILVHDESTLALIDEWVATLRAETFVDLLPLLRRTFAAFAAPVRRRLGEIVARGVSGRPEVEDGEFDRERADATLPLLMKILGRE